MIAARQALEGLRVLDLGIITAGAASSQVFADFGADVIKVESLSYRDPFRNWSQIAGGGSDDPNASPPFASVNRGKRGIAIDLKTDAGREVFLDLVRDSDIVVENFRRGVLGRLGVDFETLRAANPQIILLSLSSQGLEGPEAGFISFGSPLEALGGSMAITGYHPDEPPVWTGNNVNYPDQLVSYLAPGLALAALRARNHTGQAIHVDAAQREAVTSVVGEAVVEYSATGTVPRPIGNRHSGFAPQGVYPAIGDDEWVAISVQTVDEWQALISVDGLGKLRDDPTLVALEQRRHRHDYIDEVLADFTSTQDSAQLANDLQSLGVPASRVTRPRDVLHHPQLQALGFHQRVLSEPIIQRGFIARFSHTPAHISRQAPRLGEHTREVLQERLGYDEARIQGLQGSGAIYCEEHAEATPL